MLHPSRPALLPPPTGSSSVTRRGGRLLDYELLTNAPRIQKRQTSINANKEERNKIERKPSTTRRRSIVTKETPHTGTLATAAQEESKSPPAPPRLDIIPEPIAVPPSPTVAIDSLAASPLESDDNLRSSASLSGVILLNPDSIPIPSSLRSPDAIRKEVQGRDRALARTRAAFGNMFHTPRNPSKWLATDESQQERERGEGKEASDAAVVSPRTHRIRTLMSSSSTPAVSSLAPDFGRVNLNALIASTSLLPSTALLQSASARTLIEAAAAAAVIPAPHNSARVLPSQSHAAQGSSAKRFPIQRMQELMREQECLDVITAVNVVAPRSITDDNSTNPTSHASSHTASLIAIHPHGTQPASLHPSTASQPSMVITPPVIPSDSILDVGSEEDATDEADEYSDQTDFFQIDEPTDGDESQRDQLLFPARVQSILSPSVSSVSLVPPAGVGVASVSPSLSLSSLLDPALSSSSMRLNGPAWAEEIVTPEEFATYLRLGIMHYINACKQQGITPIKHIIQTVLNGDAPQHSTPSTNISQTQLPSLFNDVLGGDGILSHVAPSGVSLLLPHYGLNEVHAATLGALLRHNATITQLDLNSCNIGHAGIEVLAEGMVRGGRAERIERATPNEMISDNEEHQPIDQIIHTGNRTLRHLNLSYNSFEFGGGGLSSRSVHSSDCASHELPQPQLSIFGRMLSLNTSLRILHLSHCRISDRHIEQFLPGLSEEFHRSRSAVEEMRLDHNLISDRGARRIASVLEANTTLTSLDLCHNCIRDPGGTRLAESITHSALQVLLLSHNGLGRLSGLEFAKVISNKGCTLTAIDLAHNQIGGTDTWTRLMQAIIANQRMRRLRTPLTTTTSGMRSPNRPTPATTTHTNERSQHQSHATGAEPHGAPSSPPSPSSSAAPPVVFAYTGLQHINLSGNRLSAAESHIIANAQKELALMASAHTGVDPTASADSHSARLGVLDHLTVDVALTAPPAGGVLQLRSPPPGSKRMPNKGHVSSQLSTARSVGRLHSPLVAGSSKSLRRAAVLEMVSGGVESKKAIQALAAKRMPTQPNNIKRDQQRAISIRRRQKANRRGPQASTIAGATSIQPIDSFDALALPRDKRSLKLVSRYQRDGAQTSREEGTDSGADAAGGDAHAWPHTERAPAVERQQDEAKHGTTLSGTIDHNDDISSSGRASPVAPVTPVCVPSTVPSVRPFLSLDVDHLDSDSSFPVTSAAQMTNSPTHAALATLADINIDRLRRSKTTAHLDSTSALLPFLSGREQSDSILNFQPAANKYSAILYKHTPIRVQVDNLPALLARAEADRLADERLQAHRRFVEMERAAELKRLRVERAKRLLKEAEDRKLRRMLKGEYVSENGGIGFAGLARDAVSTVGDGRVDAAAAIQITNGGAAKLIDPTTLFKKLPRKKPQGTIAPMHTLTSHTTQAGGLDTIADEPDGGDDDDVCVHGVSDSIDDAASFRSISPGSMASLSSYAPTPDTELSEEESHDDAHADPTHRTHTLTATKAKAAAPATTATNTGKPSASGTARAAPSKKVGVATVKSNSTKRGGGKLNPLKGDKKDRIGRSRVEKHITPHAQDSFNGVKSPKRAGDTKSTKSPQPPSVAPPIARPLTPDSVFAGLTSNGSVASAVPVVVIRSSSVSPVSPSLSMSAGAGVTLDDSIDQHRTTQTNATHEANEQNNTNKQESNEDEHEEIQQKHTEVIQQSQSHSQSQSQLLSADRISYQRAIDSDLQYAPHATFSSPRVARVGVVAAGPVTGAVPIPIGRSASAGRATHTADEQQTNQRRRDHTTHNAQSGQTPLTDRQPLVAHHIHKPSAPRIKVPEIWNKFRSDSPSSPPADVVSPRSAARSVRCGSPATAPPSAPQPIVVSSSGALAKTRSVMRFPLRNNRYAKRRIEQQQSESDESRQNEQQMEDRQDTHINAIDTTPLDDDATHHPLPTHSSSVVADSAVVLPCDPVHPPRRIHPRAFHVGPLSIDSRLLVDDGSRMLPPRVVSEALYAANTNLPKEWQVDTRAVGAAAYANTSMVTITPNTTSNHTQRKKTKATHASKKG